MFFYTATQPVTEAGPRQTSQRKKAKSSVARDHPGNEVCAFRKGKSHSTQPRKAGLEDQETKPGTC